MGDPELEADLVEVEAIRTLGPEAALERGLAVEAVGLQAGPDAPAAPERALQGRVSLTVTLAPTAEPGPTAGLVPAAEKAPPGELSLSAEPVPTAAPDATAEPVPTGGPAPTAKPTPAAEPTSNAEAPANVHPNRSLWLLSIAHLVNHAQAFVLPLIFLQIIDEFNVSVETIAFLAAFGAASSGLVQLSYAQLTRVMSRRRILGIGGIIFGGGFAAQALAFSFPSFAIPNVISRIGGSPQHPVGNGLLAEQFVPERRGFAISAHIAGGNVGTVIVAITGAPIIALWGWRGASIIFGLPAIVIAIAIMVLIRETGTDRAAARAGGSVRQAFGQIIRDRDLRWLYLTSILGGGGRGLGVVNLFALLYLTTVLHLSDALAGLMYGVLIVFAVPMPLLSGWLSDRIGRKPVIIGVYLGGSIGFLVFLAAGTNLVGLWIGIALMGLFSFAESPQLQALLADIAAPSVRDATYAVYFTLAFGVGSLWTALYGLIIQQAGNTTGVQIVFVLMAVTFFLAALGTIPIRADERARANAAHEASL